MNTHHEQIPEEEKAELRSKTNTRISQYCNYAALVIIIIAIAAYVVGDANSFFSDLGVMISIGLLAIAAINNPTRK